ncbi:MAG: hypothetical protein PHT69_09355 [Bacteroidales bacterium]|nr:hypothetical protein [Bacteroidales bacterium]
MKKIVLSLVVVFLAVLALNSCKDANSPEAIAEKYLTHMAKHEWEQAKALGTEDTQSMIAFKMDSEEGEGAEAKIEDMKCTVTEETAVCTCKLDGADRTLNLVKAEDKWLVDEKKEMPDMGLDDLNLGEEGTEGEVGEATETGETTTEEVVTK